MSLKEIYVYRIYLSSVNKNIVDKTINILRRLLGEDNIVNINVKESKIINDFYLVEAYSTVKMNSNIVNREISRIGLSEFNFKVDVALVKKP